MFFLLSKKKKVLLSTNKILMVSGGTRRKLGKQDIWLILKARVKKGFVKYNHGCIRQRARIVLINSWLEHLGGVGVDREMVLS